jgi:hypothetical protein
MTRIVEIPQSLDDRTFETFAQAYADGSPDDKLLFDARGVTWCSPYGFVGLLIAGQAAGSGGTKPLLTVPDDAEVRSYWSRMGFFRHAAELFELHGKVPRARAEEESEVLLEITPIRGSEDVHDVVGRVQDRSARILTGKLGLEAKATMGFTMALSEACQNIVEHAGTTGWVAIQAYSWKKRLGRRVVVIAVGDGGIGFRRSLEATQARRIGERWGDGAALECALIQNISRFRDPGRGQGLAGIKRYLDRWEGKISIRSGTARLSIVPAWDDDVPLREHLAPFPGAQVQIVIPAAQGAA